MLETMERLRGFPRLTLVLWASEDRVMPPDHAHRLAGLLPDARVVYVEDSYTPIPIDQPARFAREIRGFVTAARLSSSV
jgi:pimeloyl-ACP methyl ester carboxylesterase